MNEKTKESKFLDAINRYAEQQKAQITQEIESYKAEKIEQATEKGLQDAYDLIRQDVTRRKAEIVNRLAVEELQLRNEQFEARQEICDKVFDEATDKLSAFTQTDDYTAFLQRSVSEIGDYCGDSQVVVSISPADEDKRMIIEKALSNAQIETDNTIRIGGLKAYCPARGVLLDDTLDSRLEQQREWFYEHSGLKVV